MRLIGFVIGVGLLLTVLWDAFETVVLPRRVRRRLRLTRGFYRLTWRPWRALGRLIEPGKGRENLLSVYGPLSLLLLLATWAAIMVVAFGLLHWGVGGQLQTPPGIHGFAAALYFSGTTLFTLGLGDVAPTSGASRFLTVFEGGMGLGFLALIIGYLPVLAQAFSRREANISLLDARAGSPPSAAELLRRHAGPEGTESLSRLLAEWERWSADLLETHISFPVLAYYRSQHDNQSWIAALTTILDVCALITAAGENGPVQAARLAFAIARHAAVDLCAVFKLTPAPPERDRLPESDAARLVEAARAAGLTLAAKPSIEEKLGRLRQMYEPHVSALSRFLLMPLPTWLPSDGASDNWQATR